MSTLSEHAVSVLAAYQITPGQWIAEYGYQGEWTGDACGCPDDRCIGHHHDPSDECQCLPAVIDERVLTEAQDRWTCACVYSCGDDPATACHLSGQWHTHPDEAGGFGPCRVHPDAPGDR